jgi:hypothetical protein
VPGLAAMVDADQCKALYKPCGPRLQALPNKESAMPEKSLLFVQIDDLSQHVRATLERATTPIGPSLIKVCGGMISHCLRVTRTGKDAHPGLAKIAKMGRCCERQARRNVRVLEAWGVLQPTAFQKGGRWATRYWFDLVALKHVLISLGCNPSPVLFEKIDALRGDIRGDICPDTMSAGIQYLLTGSKKPRGAAHG